jgi:hypothetical protein
MSRPAAVHFCPRLGARRRHRGTGHQERRRASWRAPVSWLDERL